MTRPFLLARATLGLAATAVEQTAELPGLLARGAAALPGLPVRLAGGAVTVYLHAGQRVTELAVRGDRVIDSVRPARLEQPDWVTFDEDEIEP